MSLPSPLPSLAARAESGAESLVTSLAIEVAGRPLWLCPERAAFEPLTRSLLIADVHFGKAATFRAAGIAVPDGTTGDNLARIDQLIARHAPQRIVFLGDLLHARPAQAASIVAALSAWRARHPTLELILVRGNHDMHAGSPAAQLRIEEVDEPWRLGGWTLCHHPGTVAGEYVLAGHEHPTFHLRGAGDALRLPCFRFGAALGVLPAFGDFTGGYPSDVRHDQVYVVAGERVIAVDRRHTGRSNPRARQRSPMPRE
ncbi:ligase-associated DNA damage response endonuclease PdeM [Robbsia sp. Bb-Pol-6]|uniref:Ligase-associated DNA damage response endonuclease PdeM n=1 Tax=Robbsia betulipollinis TaxID=2981849 RepID=A0ABT3ZMN1_9BURK|nr:ligase-associated DNA damage response endonuclease PdeM [Robbsia betulipollinis]MCY0387816.1 ligase-associated DNA damage response endonuclease PdeM [Robbsia betulipollinis]